MIAERIGMALKDVVAELNKLTPEERATLSELFGAGVQSAAAEPTLAPIDEEAVAGIMDDLRRWYPKFDDARLRKMAVERIARVKEKREPKPPRAERVYFFLQTQRVDVQGIKSDAEHPDVLKKTGYQLPDRIIAVDEKTAARLYWKMRGKYGYAGRSTGEAWARARMNGMAILEAQAVEFEAMKANPDQTAPPNREKTFFAGTKIATAGQGREISWAAGLKQGRIGEE